MNDVKKDKRLSFFGKILFFINLLLVFALCMAYLANFISPATFWFLALFGMLYPVILLANILFAIYWIIRWRSIALFSIITILAGYPYIGRHFQSNLFDRKQVRNEKSIIKLLSYNVRNFDLYNYKKNWQYNFENRDKILDFLKDENADIFCLQEFVYDNTNQFNTLDTILQIQQAQYHHIEYNVISRNQIYFGIATFSKFPIVNKAKILFPNSKTNFAIFTDIAFANDTIRIYNLHLESIHLGKEEYELAKDIEDIKINDNKKLKSGSKKILRQLRQAFVRRAEQADIIAKSIKESPYPVILCGDFNDTPCSYTYNKLITNLYDAFVLSGRGIGRSYNGFDLFFRIDYILYSKNLKSFDYKTYPIHYSDHFPVSCKIKVL